MALYKYADDLSQSDHAAFDELLNPGTVVNSWHL